MLGSGRCRVTLAASCYPRRAPQPEARLGESGSLTVPRGREHSWQEGGVGAPRAFVAGEPGPRLGKAAPGLAWLPARAESLPSTHAGCEEKAFLENCPGLISRVCVGG